MGATEEQMLMLDAANVDHVSYILILYSISFLMFLCKSKPPISHPSIRTLTDAVVNILIHIYATNTQPTSIKLSDSDTESGQVNGRTNGHLVRDVEEFELHGLASDDDEEQDEEERLLKEQNGRGT